MIFEERYFATVVNYSKPASKNLEPFEEPFGLRFAN